MHLRIDYVVSYNFHIVRLLSDPLHDKTRQQLCINYIHFNIYNILVNNCYYPEDNYSTIEIRYIYE